MSKPRKLRSRKAGMPPGSLLHIGDIKTSTADYTVIDFDEAGFSEHHFSEARPFCGHVRDHVTRWSNAYGIHSASELRYIGDAFNLHPLTQEDILNTAQRQKLDAYDHYLYLVLHRYELQANNLELTQDQISIVIGRDYVLSFQERPTKTFEPVRQRLRAQHTSLTKGGVDTLAYSLIDTVVDSYFGVIEQLNDYAEDLESQILGRATPSALEGIHQLKRCVAHLRRNLHPLREVLGSLHRDAGDFFRADIQLYLRDVYDHTVHILESLDDLRDLATSLLDVYLTSVSHRVNLEVRTLTVIATIFMPATLIAGIFGMNFREMPWLSEPLGHWYALAIMGAIAALMITLFWRRKTSA